jgi:hypothetical protein
VTSRTEKFKETMEAAGFTMGEKVGYCVDGDFCGATINLTAGYSKANEDHGLFPSDPYFNGQAGYGKYELGEYICNIWSRYTVRPIPSDLSTLFLKKHPTKPDIISSDWTEGSPIGYEITPPVLGNIALHDDESQLCPSLVPLYRYYNDNHTKTATGLRDDEPEFAELGMQRVDAPHGYCVKEPDCGAHLPLVLAKDPVKGFKLVSGNVDVAYSENRILCYGWARQIVGSKAVLPGTKIDNLSIPSPVLVNKHSNGNNIMLRAKTASPAGYGNYWYSSGRVFAEPEDAGCPDELVQLLNFQKDDVVVTGLETETGKWLGQGFNVTGDVGYCARRQSCGATLPVIRFHSSTTNGTTTTNVWKTCSASEGFSIDPRKSDKNYVLEPQPLCYIWYG